MKKTKNILSRTVAAAVGAGALLMAGAAQAALQDRDLDGDTVVDAFYDTDLDITWLRNADVNGSMDWATAAAWAGGFSFAGYEDWRLPTADPACGSNYNCTGGEMGHLWYVELGNTAGSLTNTGGFQNLQANWHWSGTDDAAPGTVWIFHMFYGLQATTSKGFAMYAMAVRDGDVAAVPEPGTYALVLAGLTGLALARRRRSR